MPSDTSSFPSRTFLKGALAVYEPDERGTLPRIVVFQYNPGELSRKLSRRAPKRDKNKSGQAREDIFAVQGPPVENISLSVELDATDQLEAEDSLVTENGLHPVLSSLEMLLYPSTVRLNEKKQLAEGGAVKVTEDTVPLVLLVLGKWRVVPVLLESFSITEQAFDGNLNPIRAKVDLGMRVLTYMELNSKSLGTEAYLSFQGQKESLADRHDSGQADSKAAKKIDSFMRTATKQT